MLRPLTLAGLALAVAAGALSITSPAAARACTKGICAESRTDGRNVIVYFSTRLSPVTHYNVRRNGGQTEVRRGQVLLFKMKKGYNQYYSVQACNRGGPLQRSSCTGWVRFYHSS